MPSGGESRSKRAKVATPAGDTLEWRSTVDGDGKLYKQGGGARAERQQYLRQKGVEGLGRGRVKSRDQNLGAANGAVTLNGGRLAANRVSPAIAS